MQRCFAIIIADNIHGAVLIAKKHLEPFTVESWSYDRYWLEYTLTFWRK